MEENDVKNIIIYYFSGTGNTLKLLDVMKKSLEVENVNVKLHEIKKNNFTIPEKDGLTGFAFPINSQSASPYVWKFLKSLPRVNGLEVFVLITLNSSSGIISPLYKLLKSKGYNVKGLCEISMPNNMFHGTADDKLNRERLESAIIKTEQFSKDLLEGLAKWKSDYRGSGFVSFLSRATPLPWIFMRKFSKFTVNSSCTKCGQCVKECTVNNISMKEVPVHHPSCEFCMRCAAYCPNSAITVKLAGKEVSVVKGRENLTIKDERI